MANLKYSIIPNNQRCASFETDLKDCLGQSVDVNGCTLLLCTEGYATISIDFKTYPVRKGDFISVSYEMTFVPLTTSAAFSAKVVSLPIEVCDDAFYQITQVPFWDYLLCHPVLSPKEDKHGRLLTDWFNQADWIINSRRMAFKKEMLQRHYTNLFMALCNELAETIAAKPQEEIKDRSWCLAGQFINLVSRHYIKHHDVEYYAKHLSITPEYLSKITLKVYDANPKELIDNQIISAIKSLLSTTELSVKQIASELYFVDPSYMCRYFKRFVNVTPLEYRNQQTHGRMNI